MTETVWRVHAWKFDNTSVDNDDDVIDVYSHYFTTREAADEIYRRGEKEVGIAYNIHWHLKRYALNADHAVEELEELIKETKGECDA